MKKRIILNCICLLALGRAQAGDVVIMQPLVAYSATPTAVIPTPALPVMSLYKDGELTHIGNVILLKQAVVTHVDKTEHNPRTWRSVPGGILVSGGNSTAEPMSVYNTMGQLVSKDILPASPTHIALPKAGVYLIKTPTQTLKIRISDR